MNNVNNSLLMEKFEKARFHWYDGYVSKPIFERKDTNYSTYHDSDIDSQIVVTIPEIKNQKVLRKIIK